MRKLIDQTTEILSNYLGHHRVKLGKEFIKFCIVGMTNLVIYMSVYWLFTRLAGWHYIAASIGGFLVAVSWSFTINLNWTFRHKTGDRRHQYIKFFISNIAVMLLNLMFLTFFIEILKIYDLFGQFLASVIGAFVNFSLNRFWTFNDKD